MPVTVTTQSKNQTTPLYLYFDFIPTKHKAALLLFLVAQLGRMACDLEAPGFCVLQTKAYEVKFSQRGEARRGHIQTSVRQQNNFFLATN